jgi:hypothetical protein
VEWAGLGFAIFGWMICYTIQYLIIRFRWYGMRDKKFYIEQKIPYDDLIVRLTPVLMPLGMTVGKRNDGVPTVVYKSLTYDILYDQDNAFTLWWRMTITRAFLSIRTMKYYREAGIAMGIIAYYIQQVASAHSRDASVYGSRNYLNQSDSQSYKFCPECGTKCVAGASFCTNCGHRF